MISDTFSLFRGIQLSVKVVNLRVCSSVLRPMAVAMSSRTQVESDPSPRKVMTWRL